MKLPFYSLLLFLLTNSAAVSNIQKIIKNTIIHVVHGDITQQPVDAIVNAANEELARGKGVCGAIFQAAEGNERKLQNYIAKNYPNGIKTGQAILTPSFDLNKKNISSIIHAVGPVYDAYTNKNEAANLLKKAYSNSLKLAQEKKLKSIAFPFISSAYFGYPKKDAADLAIEAITHFAKTNKSSITDIYIVLFEADDYKLFIEKINKIKDFDLKKESRFTTYYNRPILISTLLVSIGLLGMYWWNHSKTMPVTVPSTLNPNSFYWPCI
jgi:O-acetyl-ADP-ribose deacetylase